MILPKRRIYNPICRTVNNTVENEGKVGQSFSSSYIILLIIVMSCLAPVDDCVDEGDDHQKSDQARHHQVGSWQTLAVATIVILISNIIIVINIKMLESLGSISRHLYDDKADDGEDEAEAVDDEEGVHELWPGGDGGTDK